MALDEQGVRAVRAVQDPGVPTLMLLFPSQSYRVDAFVEAARSLGVELVLATDLPAPFERLGPRVLGADFTAPEAAAERLARAASDLGVVGIIPTNETTAVIGALAAERLGIAHNSPLSVHRTRDKRQMRARLAAEGIPGPAVRVVEPHEQAADVAGEVRFPAVVKPPMLSGSQGVIRVDDPLALERALRRVRAILQNHASPSRAEAAFHRILVEDYLPGDEVSVEALMTNGRLQPLAIFDKPDALTGPFFEETLYVTPSRLSHAQQRDLCDVAARAAKALGLTHGPVHAELRTTPGRGSAVVEIAARSIGGLCSRVFEFVAGSLEELLLSHAAGLARRAPSGRHAAAGVMMMPIPRSGVLRGVNGLAEARAVRGVESVQVGLRPGDSIRALPEGDRYLGFIFARGESADEVEAALRASYAALDFDLSPLLEVVSD